MRLYTRPNETVTSLLRRFKKQCDKSGINKEIIKHAYYEKPSEQERRRVRDRKKYLESLLPENQLKKELKKKKKEKDQLLRDKKKTTS